MTRHNKKQSPLPCKTVELSVHTSDISRLKEKGDAFSLACSDKILNLNDYLFFQNILITVSSLEPEGTVIINPETNVKIFSSEDPVLLKCFSCGKIQVQIADECSNCGGAIPVVNLEDETPKEKVEFSPKLPESKSLKRLSVIFPLGGAVLLLAVLAAVFFIIKGNKVDTPQKLMKKIHALATKGKFEELRPYTYPLERRGINYQDSIIEGIRNKNERDDFAYSDDALALIINHHSRKFEPIPGYLLEELEDLDERLFSMAQANPQDISIFDHKNVSILTVKIDKEYKLVFWEKLNWILPTTITIHRPSINYDSAYLSLGYPKLYLPEDYDENEYRVPEYKTLVDLWIEPDDPEIGCFSRTNHPHLRGSGVTALAVITGKNFDAIQSLPEGITWRNQLHGEDEIFAGLIFLVRSSSGNIYKVQIDSYNFEERSMTITYDLVEEVKADISSSMDQLFEHQVQYRDKSFRYFGMAFYDGMIFEKAGIYISNGNFPNNTQEIVITMDMANKYFGAEEPIGKILTFQNGREYVVTGIVEDSVGVKASNGPVVRIDFFIIGTER